MKTIISSLKLPWPPSVNHYFREVVILPKIAELAGMKSRSAKELWNWMRKRVRVGKGIGEKGKAYRLAVKEIIEANNLVLQTTSELEIYVECFPKTNRAYDLDNLRKALYDALEAAGLMQDDSQIQYDPFRKMPKRPDDPHIVLSVWDSSQQKEMRL